MDTKGSLLLRTVSKSIDLIMVLAVAEALPSAGWLAGLLYLLISDGLFEGQSIGKKLTGLRVLGAQGKKCTIKESIVRNSTIGAGFLLWKIPWFGWILFGAVMTLEFVVLIGSDNDARLGDELAATQVVGDGYTSEPESDVEDSTDADTEQELQEENLNETIED